MTDTITRPPIRTRATPAPAGPRLLPAALWAGGLAAAQGLLLAFVVVWLLERAEDRSDLGLAAVARAAGQVWLVAHGTVLQTPTGDLGLTPLGLLVVPLLLCRRAGRRVAGGGTPAAGATAVAAVYTGVVLLVALVAGTPARDVEPVSALVGGALVASLGARLGAGRLALPVPPLLQPALRAGAVAAAALVAAGAVLGGAALALDLGTAADLAASTSPGVAGGAGLLALGAALVPNAAVWSASWLAGPGFAVGAGTVVTPATTELGPVPALPLAAALPGGPPPSWAVVAVLVPVLAGVLAARGLAGRGWREALVGVVGCGAAAGALLALLVALSSGPVGGDRLAAVGPAAVPTALAVAGEVALGAALVVLVGRLRARRQPAAQPASQPE